MTTEYHPAPLAPILGELVRRFSETGPDISLAEVAEAVESDPDSVAKAIMGIRRPGEYNSHTIDVEDGRIRGNGLAAVVMACVGLTALAPPDHDGVVTIREYVEAFCRAVCEGEDETHVAIVVLISTVLGFVPDVKKLNVPRGFLDAKTSRHALQELGPRRYIVTWLEAIFAACPPTPGRPSVGTMRIGGKSQPVDPVVGLGIELQGERFFLKFGRYPEGDDPVYFDPDADDPRPIPEAKLKAQQAEAMEAAGVRPELIYASQKTGMTVTAYNVDQWSPDDLREWHAAIAEYQERHRPGRFRQHGVPHNKKTAIQDEVVSGYLETMQWLFEASKRKKDRRDMSLAWATLRDARVFCIPPTLASHLSDVWVALHPDEEAIGQPAWPTHFPFHSIWLGYPDSTLYDDFEDYGDECPPDNEEERDTGKMVGHLVTSEGSLWGVVRSEKTGGLAVRPVRPELSPWAYSELAPLLIEYINQKRTLILEETVKGLRRTMKKQHKLLGIKGKKIVPPPYYRVRVKTKIMTDIAQKNYAGTTPGYRHDVRGHERCRIRRGALPLAPSDRAVLEGKGYVVFDGEVDPPTLVRMTQREVPPKRPGEWLAIKTSWIDSHISPDDESLIYVPALRELDKGKLH